MSKLLTKSELMESLGVSLFTVDKYIAEGMPRVKLDRAIRFDFEEVKNWFKERDEIARGTKSK
jgi:predicted DNA-binding transcriptional regulator AlpA